MVTMDTPPVHKFQKHKHQLLWLVSPHLANNRITMVMMVAKDKNSPDSGAI